MVNTDTYIKKCVKGQKKQLLVCLKVIHDVLGTSTVEVDKVLKEMSNGFK